MRFGSLPVRTNVRNATLVLFQERRNETQADRLRGHLQIDHGAMRALRFGYNLSAAFTFATAIGW